MYNKIRSRDDHDFRKTVRELPTFQDKVGYIWYYYKIHILVTLALAAMAVSIGVGIYKNTAPIYLNGYGINVFTNQESPDFQEDYQEQAMLREFLQIPEKDRTRIQFRSDLQMVINQENGMPDSGSMMTLQLLDVSFTAREIDYMLLTENVIQQMHDRYQGSLADLGTILTPEEMETYAGRIHCTSDGMPAAIDISDSEMVKKMGLVGSGPICLAFSSYPAQPEHLRSLFEFVAKGLPAA